MDHKGNNADMMAEVVGMLSAVGLIGLLVYGVWFLARAIGN